MNLLCMMLRSYMKATEEFFKLKLESEKLENHKLKKEICSSCFNKKMRELDVQLEIMVSIIISIYII